jgi:hypothetical protein
LRKATS